MEVIGATSAIITVIQVTATVISICYDYRSSTRHFPKDVVQITHELQSLRNVLERLADIANAPDDLNTIALPTLESINVSGGPLEICRVELKQLELKLAPAESRLKQIRQALVWPLKEKEVQKTLSTLARQRGLLQLALIADQSAMTSAIRTITSRNEESLNTLNRKFAAMAREGRTKQILQWLAAPDPSSIHNKAYQMKQRETGRWLLESLDYLNWKIQESSFLWLYGIPGCGKTVLCSTIIEDIASTCQAGTRNIIAYYYFDFNEAKKQTCEGLLRSLVTQMFGHSPRSSKIIEVLFTECGEGQRGPTSEDLSRALKDLSETFDEFYIVLDALDECAEIPAVISFFEEVRAWHKRSFHILVTSRKEVVIEERIRRLTTDQVHIQSALVDADIKLLVRECLRSDPELSRWSGSIKAEVEKTLYEGSKGMFRWAVCQLDTLRRCIKPSALRKALASLPKTLDDTYERILCNIDQNHAEDALKVLQWLAFSARPLELQEVAEATAMTFDDSPRFDPENRLRHPTDLLAICSSLISVSAKSVNSSFGSPLWRSAFLLSPQPGLIPIDRHTNSADSQHERDRSEEHDHMAATRTTNDEPRHYEVRLAHDSVKEFLVSERIRGTKAAFYSISEASTHAFLTSSCLAYLMHFKEPLSDSTAEYLSEYPLLKYSAQEWQSHFTSSGDLNCNTLISPILKDFFLAQNSSFTNWLMLPFGPYNSKSLEMEEKVDDGVDLNLPGRLYHASRLGLVDICKILLEKGVSADPPTRSTTGLVKSLSTPLQIAAYMGHDAVVRLLLDYGANSNQRSVHASALDYAVAEGRESVVRLLLERNAKITIAAASPYYGLRGLPSLVLAARVGHVGIVKLVLDNGTYPRPKESYSEAYQETITQGHQNVADLLLKYGADPNYLNGNIDSDGSDVEYFDV